MRILRTTAVAVLLLCPSAQASPRDFLLRKLFHGQRPLKTTATTTPARRRVTLPPRVSACGDAVLAQPVDASWFALSGDTIFITDLTRGVLRVPKSGGTPVQVAANPSMDIGVFAVDDASVYFIVADNGATGSIYSVPRAGGTPKLLQTGLPAPIDLKIDATSIYWLNLGTIVGEDVAADGSIERMLKDGSGRQKIASGLSAPSVIDLDATDVYYGETGFSTGTQSIGLSRVSKSGGATTKLVNDAAVFGLTVSGSDIFYSGATASGLTVSRIAKSGGTSQLLIPDELALTIVVRDSRAYVVGVDFTFGTLISSVNLDGTALRVVKSVDLDSSALAVDDCAIYYAAASSLQRTAR